MEYLVGILDKFKVPLGAAVLIFGGMGLYLGAAGSATKENSTRIDHFESKIDRIEGSVSRVERDVSEIKGYLRGNRTAAGSGN